MAARRRHPGAIVAAEFSGNVEVILLPARNAVALRMSRYETQALLRVLAGRKDWTVPEAIALKAFQAKLNYSAGLLVTEKEGVDDADSR